ncbi:MAG: hypothetical protein OHK0015_14620 [Chloroflexi bacterium OHK40]
MEVLRARPGKTRRPAVPHHLATLAVGTRAQALSIKKPSTVHAQGRASASHSPTVPSCRDMREIHPAGTPYAAIRRGALAWLGGPAQIPAGSTWPLRESEGTTPRASLKSQYPARCASSAE